MKSFRRPLRSEGAVIAAVNEEPTAHHAIGIDRPPAPGLRVTVIIAFPRELDERLAITRAEVGVQASADSDHPEVAHPFVVELDERGWTRSSASRPQTSVSVMRQSPLNGRSASFLAFIENTPTYCLDLAGPGDSGASLCGVK